MASKERLSVASEPFFDMPCAVCSKSGRHEEATRTCLDCRQTLCSKCLKEHDKFDITKGHRVLDKATPITGHVNLPSQICSDHGGKLIDMYCPQHDNVCCTSCAAIHHRRCDDIDYVPAISAGTKTSKQLNTALQDITDLLVELQERKKEREEDTKRLADEKACSERTVQEYVQRLIACINDLKDKALQKIHKEHDDFQKRIDADIESINAAIASLEVDIKGMQSATNDNDSDVFVAMKQSKSHVELGTDLNDRMGLDLPREALHFNVDTHIETNLKKVESLGELETPFFSSQSLGQYKIKLQKENNESLISGICLMPAGSILMTDFWHATLKRLDSSNYNVVDHCKLPDKPFSICHTGPTEVAITILIKQMVQFVSVTTTLALTRSFRVGKNCRGIAYSKGQLFVTCGGRSDKEGPGEVRVYNTDGELLHNLPQKSTGQPFWSFPLKIAVSPDGNKVLVIEQKDADIVTMNRDGNNLNRPRLQAVNLCVQDRSLWFGCTHTTIFQFNSDCVTLGVLQTLANGIDEEVPTSVCYQRDVDRLIVGFQKGEYIKVFQLYRK